MSAIPSNPLSHASTKLLHTIFGKYWPEVWVCWKSNMKGKRVKNLVEGDLPDGDDCYFCPALLRDDATTRSNKNARRVYAMVIDDVGTKIDKEAMDMLAPQPTWTIETSSGNFQYGYAIIEDGLSPGAYHERRIAMKSHPVWGKADGIDVVHLFRLPQGTNTKNGWVVS